MASLTRSSFKLDDEPPTATVAAACSKHRRKDVLPLHPESVVQLRAWPAPLKPHEKLFPLLGRKKLSATIRQDLKRAEIPYQTVAGGADFHAAGRHTYITQRLRSGASLLEAMELARCSDVKMTMRYTHIGMKDQAKAVANLPLPTRPSGNPKSDAALHGRCKSAGAKGRGPSSRGTGRASKTSRNPKDSKGFGNGCRQAASPVKAEGMGFEPTTP